MLQIQQQRVHEQRYEPRDVQQKLLVDIRDAEIADALPVGL
jgi:hypothetical protein